VISSPASLVQSVGGPGETSHQHNWRIVWHEEPWPRHSEAPQTLPEYLAANVLAKTFHTEPLIHRQRGNHVVMLSFRQHAGGVEMRIRFWPISRDAKVGKPVDVGPIDLISA
jgi:hypothetical protein